MYLFFDTESTGFPSKQLDSKHPNQARVIQLAALLLDKDFNEVKTLYTLIKLPEGKTIDEGAFRAHGISTQECNTNGIEMESAFAVFSAMVLGAEYLIAHNIKFDNQMMSIEADCLNLSLPFFKELKPLCTMEVMTPICKLPHKKRNSFGSPFKWPKLQEAYQYIFKEDFTGAHDALSDVRATAKIFQWLVTNNHIKINDGTVLAM